MVRKAMLICIGGLTGSAKSAFLDDVFLLKLFKSWLVNEHDDKFPDIEWLYFSMERSPLHKRAKWLCWLLFNDYGVSVSIDDILSWQRGAIINPTLLPYIPRLLEYLDFLEDKVDLIGGEKYNNEIYNIVCAKLNREGYHVRCEVDYDVYTGSISGSVYVNNDEVGQFDSAVYEINKLGTKKYYVDIIIPQADGTNKEMRVYESDKLYVPYNPKKVHVIIVDHISKIRIDHGENRKTTNDQAADLLAELRDYYGVTVIIVNQFNRTAYGEDVDRMPEGFVPSETHFADSSSVIRNADLVLGILDPTRLQDWNQASYDIRSLVTEEGHCMFRSVHVVKSTYGGSGSKLGFSFIGKCGYFRSIPPAANMTDALYYMTANGFAGLIEEKTFEQHVAIAANI